MLREDFSEIFGYLACNADSCSINTNGTLITPKVARLLKYPGTKLVSLYGANARVHDYITRNPGSFDLMISGLRYLKEAGVDFIVNIIPLKSNYHQFKQMLGLAESLSKYQQIGAAWLWFSAQGDSARNREIARQRLTPKARLKLDLPDVAYEDWTNNRNGCEHCSSEIKKRSSFACVDELNFFYINPYGKMTVCCLMQDPKMYYDLRKGSFKQGWEDFIPSRFSGPDKSREYRNNCGSCTLRQDCSWCPVFGYLEHSRFSAKVEYLCRQAKQRRQYKSDWRAAHRRYYKIANLTIQLDSDRPITKNTFQNKFKSFRSSQPGKDVVYIRHSFHLPDIKKEFLTKRVYQKTPWSIYRYGDSWIYLRIPAGLKNSKIIQVAVFNNNYTRGWIYSSPEGTFLKDNSRSLTFMTTDQIFLAQILANRQGCFFHSCGVNLNQQGLLFPGCSGAGKTTLARMLKARAEILCDDRIILRAQGSGFKIYGTWSHGELAEISANCAPLKAILFLVKSDRNRILPISSKKEKIARLLGCLVRPLATVDWWGKSISLIKKVAAEVPCYVLEFDRSGEIVDLLQKLR